MIDVAAENRAVILNEIKQTALEKMLFVPTKAQQVIIDDFYTKYLWILISGGWRAGKTEMSRVLLALGYFLDIRTPPEPRLYWVLGDVYGTCREEFIGAVAYFKKLGLLAERPKTPEQGQCSCKLIGDVSVETRTADEPWRIAESAPHGIVVPESGRLKEDIYYRIRGRLMEKRGWLVLNGTLEGSDVRAEPWYPDLYWVWQGANEDNAHSYSLPSWTNTVYFPGGRSDLKIRKEEKVMPPDMFKEKFAGIPVKPSGLVIKNFDPNKHVVENEYDPYSPVEIAVDVGTRGAYAVEAIQLRDGRIHVIDEIYVQEQTTYDVIKSIVRKPWGHAIIGGAIDIASKQRQGSNKTPLQLWTEPNEELGWKGVHLHSEHILVSHGIDLLRIYLQPSSEPPYLPLMDFSNKCRGAIAEFGGGKSPIHGGGPWLWNIFSNEEIDKNNHAGKALYYYLVYKFGFRTFQKHNVVKVRHFH